MNRTAYYAIAVFLALGGGLTILFATAPFGIGLSPDSVGYLSVARNLRAGQGFLLYDGSLLTVQPPLFPALMAGLSALFGMDEMTAASRLNAMMFAVVILLTASFAKRMILERGLAPLALVAVAAGPPLFRVSLVAWSEPLFIATTMGFLILLVQTVESDRHRRTGVIFLATVAATACLSRYIGIVLIGVGGVALLLGGRFGLKKRILDALLYIVISSGPLAIWILRNYRIEGTFFGPRGSALYSLPENIVFAAETVLNWFIPRKLFGLFLLNQTVAGQPLAFWFGLSVAAFVLAVLVRLLGARSGQRFSAGAVLLLYSVAYTAFLVWGASRAGVDRLNDRLLSPVHAPLTLCLFWGFSSLLDRCRHRRPFARSQTVMKICLGLWLAYPAFSSARWIFIRKDEWLGFNNRVWRESALLAHLKEMRSMGEEPFIYSNGADAIYVRNGQRAVSVPMKTMFNSADPVVRLEDLRDAWPARHPAYLVWFDRLYRPFYFTPSELSEVANVEVIQRFDDGTLYRVSRKSLE